MFLGNYSCLFWSSKYLPSGLAAVLTSLIPVWILLEEWLVFRGGSISVRAWLGIALGIAGACLIALPGGMNGGNLTKPALILVLGTLLWSTGTLWTTRLDLPGNAAINAGLQMAWGGFLLLILSSSSGELRPVMALSQRWNWQATANLAYLIIAASVIAFTAYVWLLGREPVARVASFAYVNPLVALSLGYGLGHERPTALQYAGAVLVQPQGTNSLKLHFNHVEVHNASYGIDTDGSFLSGPSALAASFISESEFFSFPNAAVNAFSTSGTGTVNAVLDFTRILNAGVALKANGPQSFVIVTNNTVGGNTIGVQQQNGATVITSHNSTITGNGPSNNQNVSGTVTQAPRQ